MEFTFNTILENNARNIPDDEAVIFDDGRGTYGQILKRVYMRANALHQLGVKKGDHVAVLSMHSMDLVETLFAIWQVGAVFVPLNFRHSSEELVYVLNHSEADTIIFQRNFTDIVKSIKSETKTLERFFVLGTTDTDDFLDLNKETEKQPAESLEVEVSENDLATIIYTSGTTGHPKGVMATHKNYTWACMSAIMTIGPLSGSLGYTDTKLKLLMSGPFFHVGGLINFLYNYMYGAPVILMKKFDPTENLKWIEREKVERLQGVATLYNMLLIAPDIEKYDLSSVLLLGSGAETMPDVTRKSLAEVFPNSGISEGYGMTESMGIISSRLPEETAARPYSVGKAAPLVSVKVVDEKGNEVPQGEVGEIIVQGPNVMIGYYKDPEKTADAIREGWLWTHDLGSMDQEGYLYIVERKNDMIKSGGENIYPKEIEDVIYKHEKIAETAVYGVPDPIWGQKIHAAVVLKPGAEMSSEEVIEFCQANLASFKKPKFVEFLDDLPRSPVGKILRKKLRARFEN